MQTTITFSMAGASIDASIESVGNNDRHTVSTTAALISGPDRFQQIGSFAGSGSNGLMLTVGQASGGNQVRLVVGYQNVLNLSHYRGIAVFTCSAP